jgi:hypothetical protein
VEHFGQRLIGSDVIGQTNVVHETQVIFGIDIGPLDDQAAQSCAMLVVVALAELVRLILRQVQVSIDSG